MFINVFLFLQKIIIYMFKKRFYDKKKQILLQIENNNF